MKQVTLRYYALNCFLLMIPVLIWNMALASQLPDAFQPETFDKNIPLILVLGENIFRTIVFLFTLFMPLKIQSPSQKWGCLIYIAGTLIYFASWLVLIYYPDWSNKAMGFLAPAYTPLFWLTGIALMADRFYFKRPFKRWHFMVSVLIFSGFHVLHASIIYLRIH